MYKEYAVEPEAMVVNWDRFLYLIEKFGFDKGRLISRFPGNWEKRVIDAAKASGMEPVKLKSVVDRLYRAKSNSLIRSGRSFEPKNNWLANALEQHNKNPFHAIIARESEAEDDHVLHVGEFDEDTPLFQAAVAQRVPMTEKGLADAVERLLCSAKEIMLVDPYFQITIDRYANPLVVMMSRMAAFGLTEATIQIHSKDGGECDLQVFKNNIQSVYKGRIPEGFTIEVYEWRQRDRGLDFHNRYILADCGGISSQEGFGTKTDNQEFSLTLLPFQEVKELADRFRPETAEYELCRNKLVINTNSEIQECPS